MKELKKVDSIQINGGGAVPGPSTIGINLFKMGKSWIDGFFAGTDIF